MEQNAHEEDEERLAMVDEEASNPSSSVRPAWVTVDGPLGIQQEAALAQARNFFYGGFFLLPWLWFVNCFYFWPVLRHPRPDPVLRSYIVRSAIGFSVYTSLLLMWALTYAIGGEQLFGSSWKNLSVYEIADSFDFMGS